MAVPKGTARPSAAVVADLLDSPEIGRLIEELQATRWTGRPGYPIRTMIGLALAKSLYALPTWTKTVALVGEHVALQRALGCEGKPPSVWSAYRFAEKLRDNGAAVERCIDGVIEGLRKKLPTYGRDLAIDASDMPAYANGYTRLPDGCERKRFSDEDASWGRRSAISVRKGGAFYGYKLHLAACANTGLPISWRVETAAQGESPLAPSLIDEARRRGAMADTAAMDKGYDSGPLHGACAERDCLPVIPLRDTDKVRKGEHLPPLCDHGEWTFAGSDRKRGASKWRCPTGECKPASTWIKADRLHPLIPYKSKRWKAIYRKRGAVEREFGNLKHQWGLKPLRVRGLERVRLHADLTILTRLACALSRARAATARPRQRRGSRHASSRPAPTRVRPATRRE
ncbi:MAG TPA: transposase [Solirubrobacterales bacterium]|nr:transposase [Solirubrobacterales bacterium]